MSTESSNQSAPSPVFGGYEKGPNFWQRQSKTIRWLIILVALIVVGAVAFIIIKSKSKSEPEEEGRVVSVKTATAERKPISATSTAIGTIWPREQAQVSAKIASQIKTMALVKNKPVNAGDVVVTLEDKDLRAQRAEASAALHEAQLALKGVTTGTIPQTTAQDEKALRDARATLTNATAIYDRRKRLFEQGGIAQKDVEASQLAVQTAENDLRLAESTASLHKSAINPNDRAVAESRVAQAEAHLANLDTEIGYTEIRSPISGVITDQFQYQGEYASPGGKLFNVADMSRVIVKTPFADEVASQLKKGDPASVKPTDSPDDTLVGTISLVSRSGDPSNRAVEVWVDLPNPTNRLRAMGSAEVTVQRKEEIDSVIVPISAVVLDATTSDTGSVMVVDSASKAHEVKVKVGIRNKDNIQITSGLKGGETVVTEGNYALPDGTKVEVAEAEKEGGDKDADEDSDKSSKDNPEKSGNNKSDKPDKDDSKAAQPATKEQGKD